MSPRLGLPNLHEFGWLFDTGLGLLCREAASIQREASPQCPPKAGKMLRVIGDMSPKFGLPSLHIACREAATIPGGIASPRSSTSGCGRDGRDDRTYLLRSSAVRLRTGESRDAALQCTCVASRHAVRLLHLRHEWDSSRCRPALVRSQRFNAGASRYRIRSILRVRYLGKFGLPDS